jgi:hypothetical protein
VIYARLLDFTPDLNAYGATEAGDPRRVEALREASDYLVQQTGGRRMHSEIETRYFDGNGCGELWVGDIQSVTTLKFDLDGDGAFETTVTDFVLWPMNREQGIAARAIRLNPQGTRTVFPWGQRRVQIVGEFGYSRILQAVVGDAAITGTIDDTVLNIVVSEDAAGLLARGDSLFLEDEELGPVLTVETVDNTPDPDTFEVTVEARGINGTTAAAHTDAPVYLRRYPGHIERAVRADAARYLWRSSAGYPGEGFREMWPAIDSVLSSLRDPAAVV